MTALQVVAYGFGGCALLLLVVLVVASRKPMEETPVRRPRTVLAHAHPDCAGTWDEDWSQGMVRCGCCHAVVVATPENVQAASQENELAIALLEATREGAVFVPPKREPR